MLPNSQQRRSDPESEQPTQTNPIQHKTAPNPARQAGAREEMAGAKGSR